jgi:tetratricopeptide (TPR) repeat protein
MRVRNQLGSIAVAACVAHLAFVAGAAEPARRVRPPVVMKSLEARLQNGSRVVDTYGRFHRYRVEKEVGDRLWLVADCGTRGWAKREDVLSVDDAISYFSNLSGPGTAPAKAYRLRSLAYSANHDHANAIAFASMAIRSDPSYVAAYVDRAREKIQIDNLDGALADLDEALRLEPKCARALLEQATAWCEKGEMAKALADIDEAIRLEPTNPNHYLERSFIWQEKGDPEKAAADATRAISADPEFTQRYIYRAMYYLKG